MPDYLTTLEAAELSGYNAEYIRQLIRAGTLKAEKRGRDWWIDRKAFVDYLKNIKRSNDRRRGARSTPT